MNLYFLQLRCIFLKDLKVIPSKCHHQGGRGPCVPVAMGEQNPTPQNCPPADTVASLFTWTNPDNCFTSLTRPKPCPTPTPHAFILPLKCGHHCANCKSQQILPLSPGKAQDCHRTYYLLAISTPRAVST